MTQKNTCHSNCKIVPKSEFSALLKVTLDQMDSIKSPGDAEKCGIKRVLIKRFEATGMYPFNPNKVLQKLPSIAKKMLVKLLTIHW